MHIRFLVLSLFLFGSAISFAGEQEVLTEHPSLKGYKVVGNKLEVYNLEKTQLHLVDIAIDNPLKMEVVFHQKPITLEQILSLADTIKAVEESYESKKAYEEGLSSEQQRLKELFGADIDKNKDIIEIENMLEKGKLSKKGAKPSFFDGLFYVMEKKPGICAKVKSINIELEKKVDCSKNIYELPAVLNMLILNSDLQNLKLNFFEPKTIVSSLATIEVQKNLRYINLTNNNLDIDGFDFVLRSLPSPSGSVISGVIEADLSGNNIGDEGALALLLSGNNQLKSLKILSQQGKTLDKNNIIDKLFDKFPSELS